MNNRQIYANSVKHVEPITGEVFESVNAVSISEDGIGYIDIRGVIGVPIWMQIEGLQNPEAVATIDEFISAINVLKYEGVKSVEIDISSFGGSLEDGAKVYESILDIDVPTVAFYSGSSASAATIIACACDEIVISSRAQILVHEARFSPYEPLTKSTALELVDRLDFFNAEMTDIYADRTGLPSSEISEFMALNNGEGVWMNPDEAVELGFADYTRKRRKNTQTSNIAAFAAHYNINTNIMSQEKSWTSLKERASAFLGGSKSEGEEKEPTLKEKNTALASSNEELKKKIESLEKEKAEASKKEEEATLSIEEKFSKFRAEVKEDIESLKSENEALRKENEEAKETVSLFMENSLITNAKVETPRSGDQGAKKGEEKKSSLMAFREAQKNKGGNK